MIVQRVCAPVPVAKMNFDLVCFLTIRSTCCSLPFFGGRLLERVSRFALAARCARVLVPGTGTCLTHECRVLLKKL